MNSRHFEYYNKLSNENKPSKLSELFLMLLDSVVSTNVGNTLRRRPLSLLLKQCKNSVFLGVITYLKVITLPYTVSLVFKANIDSGISTSQYCTFRKKLFLIVPHFSSHFKKVKN